MPRPRDLTPGARARRHAVRSVALPLLVASAILSGCATQQVARDQPAIAGAERVTFPSRDAELVRGAPTALLGWLFRPPGPGPFPAVVALHGCGGLYGKSGDLNGRHRAWAEHLSRSGYVVLLPDSFTPRGVAEVCTVRNRPVHPGRERVADAYGALAYLQSLPFVRGDRVAILGWSNGGSTVLATVRARAAPRPRGLADDFRAAIAFYPGCSTALRDPEWLPIVAPLHVLIGAADDWTPAEPCRELGRRASEQGAPMEVMVFDGAYHDFDAPDLPLRVRHGIATTRSGTATVGTNEAARTAAIARVDALLRASLVDGARARQGSPPPRTSEGPRASD